MNTHQRYIECRVHTIIIYTCTLYTHTSIIRCVVRKVIIIDIHTCIDLRRGTPFSLVWLEVQYKTELMQGCGSKKGCVFLYYSSPESESSLAV
jgi:hypothetical protein